MRMRKFGGPASPRRAGACRGCRPLLATYRHLLRTKPFRASMVTAMVIMCTGDMAAQMLECRSHGGHYDPRRTGVMTGYSAVVFTPMYFGLYRLMEAGCSRPGSISIARHSLFVLAAGAPADLLLLAASAHVDWLLLGWPETMEEANLLALDKLRTMPRLLQVRSQAHSPLPGLRMYNRHQP